MRILMVGAGAVGGYFGGRLVEAGRDVTFLVRPRRAAQLAADGLRITSPHGDVTLAVSTTTADTITGAYDAVVLAVKAYGLEQAIDDFAPAIGADTMIVPLLNGMRHMDLLDARYGAAAVLGGVCMVATTIAGDGRIVQLNDMQGLAYGERSGEQSARVGALHAALSGAGFDAQISPDVMQRMWEKWIFLAALGGITCLLRGTIGDIAAAPGGADLALQLLDECSAVSAASGYPTGAAFAARMRPSITQAGSPMASSMYRDLTGGHPVEADHIIGDMLDRAHRLGVAAPVLTAAYAHLKVYQNRLAAA